ncbi:MAG: DUF1043 family protein [Pseudomonadota bacterium]
MEIVISAVIGIVLGVFFGIFIERQNARDSGTRESELEQAIKTKEQELSDYKEKVDAHFQKTAEMFSGITEQYRSLYTFMASESEDLCTQPVAMRALEQQPDNQQKPLNNEASSNQSPSITKKATKISGEAPKPSTAKEKPKSSTTTNSVKNPEPIKNEKDNRASAPVIELHAKTKEEALHSKTKNETNKSQQEKVTS